MIKIMCNANDVGAYADLSYTRQVQQYNPGQVIYCRDFAEGAVVAVREMNGYDDSDFYATFFNAETGKFEEVCYASTRYWTYPCSAKVDATPDVVALYEVFLTEQRVQQQAQKEARAALVPTKGKVVEVSISRGKNKNLNGKRGEVFWYGEDKYRQYAMRVGVVLDGIKLFFSSENVKVVQDCNI